MPVTFRMMLGYMKTGERIVGEGCHIVDLMKYLVGDSVAVRNITINQFSAEKGEFRGDDNKSITLNFEDGSIAVIDYFSCGSKELSKEYLEIHFDNKSLIMDDYKQLRSFGVKVKIKDSLISQKGHKEEWLVLYEALRKGYSPINFCDLEETTRLSILSAEY